MARLNVNPTRMEMTRLKQQLKMATRGHKLLKDKLDELMKQFLNVVRENKRLREEAEGSLESAYKNFVIAKAVMSEASLSVALMIPQQSVSVKVGQKNIMSVDVPVFDFQKGKSQGDIYPYGFVSTSGELDNAMVSFSSAMEPLLRLAESEKTAQLLAQEIEKTRRRVNALENVMIPNHIETIKYITLKLEENDRASKTGVIKVKEMVMKKAAEEKKKFEAEREAIRQAKMAGEEGSVETLEEGATDAEDTAITADMLTPETVVEEVVTEEVVTEEVVEVDATAEVEEVEVEEDVLSVEAESTEDIPVIEAEAVEDVSPVEEEVTEEVLVEAEETPKATKLKKEETSEETEE